MMTQKNQTIQRLHVLNEQARRWTVMNTARRDGRPYLPHDTDADEEFDAFGERRYG